MESRPLSLSAERSDDFSNEFKVPSPVNMNERALSAEEDFENEKTEIDISTIEEDLTDDHSALVEAINKDCLKEVTRLLNIGINLDVLIPIGTEAFTPLGIAVSNINVGITKILLENNADPNLKQSDNRSIVEILLIAIGNLDIQSVMGAAQKRPLKLFGKETPFKVKVILTPNKIEDAHNILDLLLCYGLKPNFVWTDFFEKSVKSLTETVQHFHNISVSKKALPELMDAGLRLRMQRGVRRTLLSGAAKSAFWLRDHIKSRSSIGNIPTYIESVSLIKGKINEACNEIGHEKNDLFSQYRAEIEKGTTVLPIVLIDIIIQYTLSFSKEIASKRLTENRTLKFWVEPENDVNRVDQEVRAVVQSKQYEFATRHLESLIGSNARKILIEYLLSNEPDVCLDQNPAMSKTYGSQ